jgi:hypothetical protein
MWFSNFDFIFKWPPKFDVVYTKVIVLNIIYNFIVVNFLFEIIYMSFYFRLKVQKN